MKTKLLLCLFLLSAALFAFKAFTPTRVVKGLVTDKLNNPIAFANVLEKESRTGVSSDLNGRFSITVNTGAVTLLANSVGYGQGEVVVAPGTDSVHIILTESSKELMDVVVTEKKSSGKILPSFRRSHKVYCPTFDGPSKSKTTVSGSSVETIAMDATGEGYEYREEKYKSSEGDKAAYSNPNIKAGVLTAGEINDFSKWNLWQDIKTTDLSEWRKVWNIRPEQRYMVQLLTDGNMPVINAQVDLRNEKGKIIWSARTDNTGKAELWANIFSDSAKAKGFMISITAAGQAEAIQAPMEFHDGVNILKVPVKCDAPPAIDVAFVVDATGSMQDEIDYLKAEMNNIIARAKDSLKTKDLNLGCVFYRDLGDDYLTLKSDLSAKAGTAIDFIKTHNAGGGGDNPEGVDAALNVAVNELSWRENATARILFLILDAPPHTDPVVKAALNKQIQAAAAKGIRIVPVACSGIDKSTEYLLRSFALATNGTYVFLTDHSGVGGSHIAPTTDKYDVELLNNILFRVIYNFSYTLDCNQEMLVGIPELVSDTTVIFNPDAQLAVDSVHAFASIDSVGQVDPTIQQPVTGDKPAFVNWKYFPNPTDGLVHVRVEGKIKELYVTDIAGKIILRYLVNDTNFDVNLTPFPAGTYFLACEYAEDKLVKGKVVLVH